MAGLFLNTVWGYRADRTVAQFPNTPRVYR
jgi:hypothetical protein